MLLDKLNEYRLVEVRHPLPTSNSRTFPFEEELGQRDASMISLSLMNARCECRADLDYSQAAAPEKAFRATTGNSYEFTLIPALVRGRSLLLSVKASQLVEIALMKSRHKKGEVTAASNIDLIFPNLRHIAYTKYHIQTGKRSLILYKLTLVNKQHD